MALSLATLIADRGEPQAKEQAGFLWLLWQASTSLTPHKQRYSPLGFSRLCCLLPSAHLSQRNAAQWTQEVCLQRPNVSEMHRLTALEGACWLVCTQERKGSTPVGPAVILKVLALAPSPELVKDLLPYCWAAVWPSLSYSAATSGLLRNRFRAFEAAFAMEPGDGS